MAPRVLIVEDDGDVRRTLSSALERAGFAPDAVGTAAEAYKAIQAAGYHAIVCDFAMPGVDGSTFHARLLEIAPQLAERVVFVTGWGADEKTRRLLDYTGRPVLTKPVEMSDLVAAVRRVAGG